MVELIDSFTADPTVLLIGILVALRFATGVLAALVDNTQAFRLAFVADILRNDVLGKVIPYFALWAAVQVGGDIDLGGLDVIEEGAAVVVIAALTGAILNSLRDLGLLGQAPDPIAGPDPVTPVVPPSE